MCGDVWRCVGLSRGRARCVGLQYNSCGGCVVWGFVEEMSNSEMTGVLCVESVTVTVILWNAPRPPIFYADFQFKMAQFQRF